MRKKYFVERIQNCIVQICSFDEKSKPKNVQMEYEKKWLGFGCTHIKSRRNT